MPQVSGFAFLQALGYAIVNSLWQCAALWLIYIVVAVVFKPSSVFKYSLGVIVQICSFVSFLATIVVYNASSSSNSLVMLDPGYSLDLVVFLPYLSVLYLLLLTVPVCRWILSYQQASVLKEKGLTKIPIECRLFVQRVANHLGIKRNVCVYLSNLVQTPLTIGFLKPVILIPLATLNNLSKEQMEAVLLHELAHIRRYDYLLNLILAVIEAALYFNPFTHLMSLHIKEEREHSCDDLVLQFQYSPACYSAALLKIALEQKAASPAFALPATTGRKMLLHRIKRIIGKKECSRYDCKQVLSSLLFLLVALLSFFVIPLQQTTHRNTTGVSSLVVLNDRNLFDPYSSLVTNQSIVKKVVKSHLSSSLRNSNVSKWQLMEDVSTMPDNQQLYHNVGQETADDENLIAFIPALNIEDRQNEQASPLEKKLLDDINLTVEQAKKANKQIDGITIKTIMLARVQQMIAVKKISLEQSVEENQRQLELLEKKIANNIIGNIIVNNSGKIEQTENQLKIIYTVPEDSRGNSYCFEYIIDGSKEETDKADAQKVTESHKEVVAIKEKQVLKESSNSCSDSKVITKRHLKSAKI